MRFHKCARACVCVHVLAAAGEGPTVFASVKKGDGVEEITGLILRALENRFIPI